MDSPLLVGLLEFDFEKSHCLHKPYTVCAAKADIRNHNFEELYLINLLVEFKATRFFGHVVGKIVWSVFFVVTAKLSSEMGCARKTTQSPFWDFTWPRKFNGIANPGTKCMCTFMLLFELFECPLVMSESGAPKSLCSSEMCLSKHVLKSAQSVILFHESKNMTL